MLFDAVLLNRGLIKQFMIVNVDGRGLMRMAAPQWSSKVRRGLSGQHI